MVTYGDLLLQVAAAFAHAIPTLEYPWESEIRGAPSSFQMISILEFSGGRLSQEGLEDQKAHH